jgi:hypothetical protein
MHLKADQNTIKLTAMTKTLLKKSSRGCIKSREASPKVLISTPKGWVQLHIMQRKQQRSIKSQQSSVVQETTDTMNSKSECSHANKYKKGVPG